ncbi:hypothetical protein GMA10_06180 [Kocuria koreensis]|uniref:Uncharacterized protein n=1 Tax=Rothia koreensis TaxID=592378 RepID=A0A7K1LI59_9MICC|nr:hypothetical protein [Rothia koreensis]
MRPAYRIQSNVAGESVEKASTFPRRLSGTNRVRQIMLVEKNGAPSCSPCGGRCCMGRVANGGQEWRSHSCWAPAQPQQLSLAGWSPYGSRTGSTWSWAPQEA